MLVWAVAAILIAAVQARPNDVWPLNVVTVPPNCPDGQQWINGQCREIWNMAHFDLKENILRQLQLLLQVNGIENKNMIVVPPNCKPGQQLVNGACRDVWRSEAAPQNVISVPPNCPDGQVYVNGQCRDVWYDDLMRSKLWILLQNYQTNAGEEKRYKTDIEGDYHKNIISVPDQCPVGYKPDALGYCRPIFRF